MSYWRPLLIGGCPSNARLITKSLKWVICRLDLPYRWQNCHLGCLTRKFYNKTLNTMSDSNNSSTPTTLSLEDFDCIGLDIDHTLCKYKLDNFFPLSYDYSAKLLVEEKGYDEGLLQPFEMDKDMCIKGMVFDSTSGDFLKLSDSGMILRASHGTKMMSDSEIETKYGTDRQWQHFHQLESTLQQSEKFGYTENYYDLPFMVLLARMIDLQQNDGLIKPKVFKDCVEGYVEGFRYGEKKNTILSACEEEPSKYVEQCSQHLKTWLRGLHDKFQMVFLLSSAHPHFANSIMNYILGDDWQSYFHICLLQARKPGFFSTPDPSKRPFYTLVDGQRKDAVTELQHGQCYLEGNVQIFNEYIRSFTGKEHPKVLYIGDSIRSDVHPSNVYGNWQSVLVLEEMEVEELIPNGTRTLSDKEKITDKANIRSSPCQLEREFLLSDQWGSFFGDHLPVNHSKPTTNGSNTADGYHSPVMVNTLWTRLMRKHASIAIPKLDYMADFPTNFKFETFSSRDWRKGYHPGMPKNVTC